MKRRNKIKLIIFFILLHWFFYPQYSFMNWEDDRITYYEYEEQFKWLDKDLYYLIQSKSRKYNLDIRWVCSIIKAESNGKNIRSKYANPNGTYDWGIMQINEVHIRGANPRILLEKPLNIELGTWYLSRCLKRAKGNYMTATRMYNQGMNGNEALYTNWKYVSNVLNTMMIAGL